MADVKISALPAATTPLAGTEVLPIVQSGVTTKVAVSNLTAGRSVSATAVAITGSTSGTATIVTPAVAGTPTITLPIVTGTLATLAGTETLTNKTLTSPVIAAITNTGTLTLPTSTDTLVGKATTDTLTNKTLTSPTLTTPNIDSAQFATVSGTAPIYPCRAWVNFNGTGTVAIRASGNVSSITDNGTGDYTVNFTTAMSDANYGIAGFGGSGAADNRVLVGQGGSQTSAAGSCRIASSNSTTAALTDYDRVYIAIFR